MAAPEFRCGHKHFHAQAFEGRCQQAHHQMVLVECAFMDFPIAANVQARNRIRNSDGNRDLDG